MSENPHARHQEAAVAHGSGLGERAIGEDGGPRNPVLAALEAYRRTHLHRSDEIDAAFAEYSEPDGGVRPAEPPAQHEGTGSEHQLEGSTGFPMSVRLSQTEIQNCDEIGRRRQAATGHLPDAHGLEPAQRLLRHQQGARAEKAVSVALGLPWVPEVDDYREIGGNDVGPYGVRATEYTTGGLILHPKDEDERVFILVVARAPDFTLVGWLRGADGKRQEFWNDTKLRRSPAYLVEQRLLHTEPLP